MKIQSIQISNFIGAQSVDVKLSKPVCLITGKNGAGKSSIAEAIRQALTGEHVRVSLKKEFSALVTEGQESGFVEVVTDAGSHSIVLPSGKGQHVDNNPALPFVLDAGRFARLDANERRGFLFGLMGLKTDGEAVKQRMHAKGCQPARIEQIAPFLRAGFDAGHKEAQGKAREAKASWKTVAGGETYGSVKAATWKADKPAFDAAKLADFRKGLADIERELEERTTALGDMQARARQAAERAGKLEEFREKAGKHARIAEKLARDEKERNEWLTKVAETREKAGKAPAARKAFTACPDCGVALLIEPGNRLVKYEPPQVDDDERQRIDPEAAAKLPEYENALALLEKSVANDKRDLEAADAAGRMLKDLEDAGLTEAPGEETIRALKERIEALKLHRGTSQSSIRALEDAERQSKQADEKTASAAGHHADVLAWEQIADALAPDGIPGEMLAEALEPINERLAYSANEAQWTRINIGRDMSIYAAEEGAPHRPYALLSESEKWRADAMLAEAISTISGTRLIALDRFDVLDGRGREDCIYWLDGLAADGEIDTALLFGTLKSLPSQLLNNTQAVWIENGSNAQLKEAA